MPQSGSPNTVGISVRTGPTLTFAKSGEMNFPAGQFRHFRSPFTTADYRRAVSERSAFLPDVALLARLVR